MGRDNMLNEADEKRQQNDQDADGEGERKRVTQRIPVDLVAEIDEVQEQYHLPSRNAAINFILAQGTDQLLDEGGGR